MSKGYFVRQKAKEDIENIWLYSREKWGIKQADAYLRLIRDKFTWLVDYPEAGRRRSEIKEGFYSTPVGTHIIFFKLKQRSPEIIRVLHQRADMEKGLRNIL